ncbi:hypothetical protein [Geosporobacter ferrireducens]|uniref:hypothetical protein n=1 Tax=Geosporobacter ferrireducens TaxID=1424294 RepID=UPI00139CA30F|nr:hypothetical protein [Geosporobacter ferrireducens]MTI57279.1 hypothetical protein [Geosporobacter ferrireducens]
MMRIPISIQDKLIPFKNVNPLQQIAENESIAYLKELTTQMLNKYYSSNTKLFWQAIEQLGFLGVQFGGEMAKYNVVSEEEVKQGLKITYNRWDEEISFDSQVMLEIKHTLLNYGMYCKGDLNGVPAKSILIIGNNNVRIFEDLQIQGFYIDEIDTKEIQMDVFFESDSTVKERILKFEDENILINSDLFEVKLEEIYFSHNVRLLNLLKKLKKKGYKIIGDLPEDIGTFLNTFPHAGELTIQRFVQSLKNLIQNYGSFNIIDENSVVNNIKLREMGQFTYFGEKYSIPDKLFDYPIKKPDFPNCPNLIENLELEQITTIGDMPADLSDLHKFKGVGRGTISKFLINLNLIKEKCQIYHYDPIDGRYLKLLNKRIMLPSICFPKIINVSTFSSKLQTVVEYLSDNSIIIFGALPSDLDEFFYRGPGIGKTKIKLFGDELESLIEKEVNRIKDGKFFVIHNCQIHLPSELLSIKIDLVNFPNSKPIIDICFERQIYILKDLTEDVFLQIDSSIIVDFISELKGHLSKYEFQEQTKALFIQIESVVDCRRPENISERNWDIFLQRAITSNDSKKSTLDELGKKYNLTRERTRQIAKKTLNVVFSPFKKYIEALRSKIESNRGFISIDNLYLTDIISCEMKCIFKYLLYENDISYDIENGMLYTSSSEGVQSIVRDLKQYLREVLPCIEITEEDIVTAIEMFLGTVDGEGVLYNINSLLKIAKEKVLVKCSNGYKFDNVSKSEMYVYIFAKEFPTGLAIYKDFDILTDKLRAYSEWGCELDSKRNVTSILVNRENQGVILWGWGEYIHTSNLDIKKEDLEVVVTYIKGQLEQGIGQLSVLRPFELYSEYLAEKNIPNEYALYSCLRMFYGDEFYLPKAPWILPPDVSERQTNDEVVESFLYEYGEEITYEELKEEFIIRRGWKESMLLQAMTVSEKIIRSNRSNFCNIDVVGIDEKLLLPLIMLANNKLGKESTISIRKIFTERKAYCYQHNISNDILLYSILKYYYSDKLSFPRYPHVQKIGHENQGEINYRNLVEKFIEDANRPVFRTELIEKFENRMGWERYTLDNALSLSNMIIPVESGHEYVHRKVIGWNKEKQSKLKNCLIEKMQELINQNIYFTSLSLLLRTHFFESLPELDSDITWTTDILNTFIGDITELETLGTKKLVLIMVPNPINVEDEIDLIEFILKSKFDGAAKLRELEKELESIDLISSYFPRSYYGEDEDIPYEISGDEIILKELRDAYA